MVLIKRIKWFAPFVGEPENPCPRSTKANTKRSSRFYYFPHSAPGTCVFVGHFCTKVAKLNMNDVEKTKDTRI
jgi:hypothetical protein